MKVEFSLFSESWFETEKVVHLHQARYEIIF